MSSSERITSVIVDTNAFIIANSDFLGIKSSLLPSFFAVIKEKEIKLLGHPILEKEIEKHIEDSSLYKDYQNLKSNLNKCDEILKLIGCKDDKFITQISGCDMKQKLFQAFKDNYRDACILKYPNPEKIFERYFAETPPFSSTGKKKNEFPDAFVIESIKNYISEHTNDILLIVSNDNDWKTAFEKSGVVEICDTIDEAVKRINSIKCILDSKMLDLIFKSAYDDMIDDAHLAMQCECYVLRDYETIDDLNITDVFVESISDIFIPLKITRESLLIKTDVSLVVGGETEIFDEENSVWDSEERDYIFKEYADVKFKGTADVECEIEIAFDFDELESSSVRSFKFTNSGNIEIQCDDIEIQRIDEDEMALRCLREDKGLPRKTKNIMSMWES